MGTNNPLQFHRFLINSNVINGNQLIINPRQFTIGQSLNKNNQIYRFVMLQKGSILFLNKTLVNMEVNNFD